MAATFYTLFERFSILFVSGTSHLYVSFWSLFGHIFLNVIFWPAVLAIQLAVAKLITLNQPDLTCFFSGWLHFGE